MQKLYFCSLSLGWHLYNETFLVHFEMLNYHDYWSFKHRYAGQQIVGHNICK